MRQRRKDLIADILAWVRKEPTRYRILNLVQLAIVGFFVYGLLFGSVFDRLWADNPGMVLVAAFVVGLYAGHVSRQKEVDREKSVAETYRNDWAACCRELERLGIRDPAVTIRHSRPEG
jgi:hypothetical protein